MSENKKPKLLAIEEYENYTKEYKEKFGEKTVVLYHSGDFYEIYSYMDEPSCVNIDELHKILHMKKAKKENVKKKHYMTGGPTYMLYNYVSILKENLYTIVIVNQVTPPPNVKRCVVDIISPGMSIGLEDVGLGSSKSNITMVAYFSEFPIIKSLRKLVVIGYALVDFSTGYSSIAELNSTLDSPTDALEELKKEIEFRSPEQIILLSDPSKLEDKKSPISQKNLLEYLYLRPVDILSKTVMIKNMLGQLPECFKKESYQKALFEKVFSDKGMNDIFEYIELDRKPIASVAYAYMLNEAKNHNELLISKLKKPNINIKNDILRISPSSIQHLELFDLEDITNTSITHIGKTRYRERLLSPHVDSDKINKSYEIVEALIKDLKFEDTKKYLKEFSAIDRLFWRMEIGRLAIEDFFSIHTTLEGLLKLRKITKDILPIKKSIIKDVISTYTGKIDVSSKHKSTLKIFMTGYNQEIDDFIKKHTCLKEELKIIAFKISEFCKINYKSDCSLVITKIKWDCLGKLKGEYKPINYEVIDFSKIRACRASKTTCHKLSHPIIDQMCDDVIDFERLIKQKVEVSFLEFTKLLAFKFSNIHFKQIIKYIADVDWYVSCAETAWKRKYVKPIINNKYGNKSYLDAKNIRHPIIENVQNDINYVANDVELGTPSTEGILLYGVNGIGKSSMCKTIALSIIMAQAGMFVPADFFEFCPYERLFTRIPTGDNLKKGQSTFTREAVDLIEIIKLSDKKTLVVGDELCSGTESLSALTIVRAGIISLYEKRTSFVFATHIHNLLNERIKKLSGLKVFHFSSRTLANGEIVYDRKLQEGQGNTVYGLEICGALGMDKDFMKLAYELRSEILEENGETPYIIPPGPSNYNSKVYTSTCFCGKEAVEDHHILHQTNADERGFIGHIHKNHASNIIGVCSTHHDEIHSGHIQVSKVQTTAGVKVDVSDEKGKDLSVSINKRVFDLKAKGYTQKLISVELGISLYRLKKILTSGR